MKKKDCKNVMPGEKDEKGQNKVPHTHYGLMSNLVFLFRNIWLHRKIMLIMFVIGIITQSIMRYLWSFIGKYIIDIIEAQTRSGTNDISQLIRLLIKIVIVEVVVIGAQAIISNRVYLNMTFVRFQMITEKNDKLLSMNYQVLEQPHILDMHQRASHAIGGNTQGYEDMMKRVYHLSAYFLTLAVTTSTILGLDPRLILVLTLTMVFNYLSQQWSIRNDKKYFWDGAATTRRQKDYMGRCTQDFDYAKDIRLYSLKPWLLKKQKAILDDYQSSFNRSRNCWLRHSCIYSTTSLLASGFMYYILINQVIHQNVSIGNFTLYLGLCGAFSQALSDFYSNFGRLQSDTKMVDDLRTFLDFAIEKEEDCLDISILGDSYHFEFKDVCFRYEGAKEDTIKHLNLSLPAGQRLAVVGLNGAGKTTMVKLLCRLYDPTEGEILMDGINIKEYDYQEYMKVFAPVFQDFKLFAFSIRENLMIKDRKERNDRDEKILGETLKKVDMTEKITSFKNGVDTVLFKHFDTDGIEPSGGEQQKLAIARALIKDAPVVILDEPTAALDPIAEYEIYKNFQELVEGKTAIYISHRLSSCQFCDRIAVFSEGNIKEYGTHEELVNQPNGIYAEMFAAQAQYYVS